MLQFRLGSDDAFLTISPRWADLGDAGQTGALALSFLLPIALVVWLYRYELRVIARLPALGLLALRLLVITIIWLAVAVRPHLAQVEVEELPSRVRVAVDLSTSMDVADIQRTAAEKERLADALQFTGDVDTLTRRAIVERLLAPNGLGLLDQLTRRHQVEIVGFHDESAELQPAQLLERLTAVTPVGSIPRATDLGSPLAKLTTQRTNPLLGVILFSDGRHNLGAAPITVAESLGIERVRIFPVLVGSPRPPNDLIIVNVQAPSKIFKNMTAPIEVHCKVVNLPAHEFTVEMQIEGKPTQPEHRQTIKHTGVDTIHTIRFQAKMEEVGTHALTIKATSKDQKEITLANNEATRVIRVAQDKAKVLLVDGEARWEYHYLATTLARDPTIELDRVVFVQPRIGKIKDAELEKLGSPKRALPVDESLASTKAGGRDPLMDYDCILLGDVSPEQLPSADRKRLEKYVSERSGTLILVAGKRYLPLAYTAPDDPLAKMLPITEPRVLQVDDGFYLKPTVEGKLRPFLQLEPEGDDFTWPELPKHFWGIVGKPKPAAAVLLTAEPDSKFPVGKSEADRGIFVQHNYGYGRVLFVGLDSTWRWRYRKGDAYQHRFWGQMVRWSAADKLLPAGNRFIRYGSREPIYNEGQEVELAVRLHESLPPLDAKAEPRAKLHRKNAQGIEELVVVAPLQGNARNKQLLDAKVRDLPAGLYRIELDIPPYRVQLALPDDESPVKPESVGQARDSFRVLAREPKELLDLSTDEKLLQALAQKSGGRMYSAEDVQELIDRLARRVERKEHRHQSMPWQDEPMVYWLLSVLLGLLSVEWAWRKWLELP